MKKLTFDYYMQIDYSETVSSCHFTIKCLPKETLRQRAENVKVLLSPDVPTVWEGTLLEMPRFTDGMTWRTPPFP